MQTLKAQIKDLQAKAKARAEADADGNLLPLPFFLNILNDPEADEGMRFAAAKEAAPFLHPRLQATVFKDMSGKTHEQRLAEFDALCDPPKTINHQEPAPCDPGQPSEISGNGKGAGNPAATEAGSGDGTPAFVPLATIKQH